MLCNSLSLHPFLDLVRRLNSLRHFKKDVSEAGCAAFFTSDAPNPVRTYIE